MHPAQITVSFKRHNNIFPKVLLKLFSSTRKNSSPMNMLLVLEHNSTVSSFWYRTREVRGGKPSPLIITVLDYYKWLSMSDPEGCCFFLNLLY